MAITPRGIWTPDSGEEYDLTVDAATTASTVDAALQKAANYGLGTQAEMNAALGDFPNGAMWFNTTNSTEYRRVSGAWVSVAEIDTGWVNLSLTSGWGVQSGRTPRIRRIGDIVYLQGQVSGGGSGGTTIANLPTPGGVNLAPVYTLIYANYLNSGSAFFSVTTTAITCQDPSIGHALNTSWVASDA